MVEIFMCFILSLFFRKKGLSVEKYLVPFFLLLFCVESYCGYLYSKNIDRHIVYNFWFPIEFIFYGIFITAFINSVKTKFFLRIVLFIYFLGIIIYYLFFCNITKFASKPFLLGAVMLILVLLIKLYEILNKEITFNPLKNPIFWFIAGLLLENICSFFFLGAINYLSIKNESLLKALSLMNVIFTDVQYFFFLLYFYCKWKYQK